MPIAILPADARQRREKTFGTPARPLDRNARVRVLIHARAYNAAHRRKGQHRGPLTRATLDVLKALLWGFLSDRDGRCFPSYDAVARAAGCHRSTVHAAIRALEEAGILAWVHRLVRVRERVLDLFGRCATRWRVMRTSNAYIFRDLPPRPEASKSENSTGVQKEESISPSAVAMLATMPASSPLREALERLGARVKAREALA